MIQLAFGNIPDHVAKLRKEKTGEETYTETYFATLPVRILTGGQYEEATAHATVTVLKDGYVTPKVGDFSDEDEYRKELARLKNIPTFFELDKKLQEAIGDHLTKILANHSHVFIEEVTE